MIIAILWEKKKFKSFLWGLRRAIAFMLITFLGGLSGFLLAQENNDEWKRVFEDLAESLSSRSEHALDYTSLLEELEELQAHPVSINTHNQEELKRLFILSDFQTNSLHQYILENGPILSLYELQFVYGFDQGTVELISPFISLEQAQTKQIIDIKKPVKYGRHQILLRTQSILETQEGYLPISDSALSERPNSRNLGSPWKVYTRYSYSYKKQLLLGFTAEKDAGEEFFSGSNKQGYDYYSGFIQLNNVWKIKTIVIGDYEPRFGQGLNLWSGFAYGKSTEPLFIEKRQSGIRRYTSTNENQFFRGMATTISLGDFDLSVFVSSKKIDANVLERDSLDQEPDLVSGFIETGIHATPGEISDRRSLSEMIYGGNLNYTKNRFHAGLTMVQFNYDAKINAGNSPYEVFDFGGKSGSKIGSDYKYTFRKGTIFGELSCSPEHGWAFIQGGLFPLAEQLSLAILYRYYSPGFIPIYSNAFSENSSILNENGFYIGARIFPFRKWNFSTYIDIYSFPWLKYRTSAPSQGSEFFFQANYATSNSLKMHWRIQYEKKSENLPSIEEMVKIGEKQKWKARYQVDFQLSGNLELRNRVEWTGLNKNETFSEGYLIYQDIIYRSNSIPLDVTFRYALFDTESYDNRIYAYENNVLYAFSIPPYYGKGIRTYILLHSSINKHLDLWFRISRTIFSDRKIIGSGLTTIDGNHKTELKLQARLKF